MDAAGLRIKFAPFIKNIHNFDSKCCVEIIPEVSCNRDLERINWNIENDLIEYTIPMTYKIAIKKQQPVCYDESLERTYHSCVDLLPSDSLANTGLDSGDVMRIFSDNIVFNKFYSDNIFDDEDILKTKKSVIAKNDSVQDVTTPVRTAKQVEELEQIVKEFENLLQSRDGGLLYEDQLQKLENLIEAGTFDDEPIADLEADKCSPIISPKRKHSQYKLSLSPICSICTTENISKDSKGSISKKNDKILYSSSCTYSVRGAINNCLLQAINSSSCDSRNNFIRETKPFTTKLVKNCTAQTLDQTKQEICNDQKVQKTRSYSDIRQSCSMKNNQYNYDLDKVTETILPHVSEGSLVSRTDHNSLNEYHQSNFEILSELNGANSTKQYLKLLRTSPDKNLTKRNYNKLSKRLRRLQRNSEQATHLVSIDGTFDSVIFKNNAEKSANNMVTEEILQSVNYLGNTNQNNSKNYRNHLSPPTIRNLEKKHTNDFDIIPHSQYKLQKRVFDNLNPSEKIAEINPINKYRRSTNTVIRRGFLHARPMLIDHFINNTKTPKFISPYVTSPKNYISKALKEELNFKIPERILPEIRVDQFVRKLEMDFHCLTAMINDIHCKCAAIGLFLRKKPQMSNAESVYQTLPDSSCDSANTNIDTRSSENSTRSNRVVYTIEFEG